MTNDGNIWTCTVCATRVEETHLKDHINSRSHKRKVEWMIHQEEIKRKLNILADEKSEWNIKNDRESWESKFTHGIEDPDAWGDRVPSFDKRELRFFYPLEPH